MLCRWQTSSYRDACLQLPVNYFVQGQEKQQSVTRVEVTCLFAVAEAELVLKLEAVVAPVGPIAGKLSLIRDLPKVPRFTITNLTARVERSSCI
jgi:hypothetical protein